jgi:hypothetical protein
MALSLAALQAGAVTGQINSGRVSVKRAKPENTEKRQLLNAP